MIIVFNFDSFLVIARFNLVCFLHFWLKLIFINHLILFVLTKQLLIKRSWHILTNFVKAITFSRIDLLICFLRYLGHFHIDFDGFKVIDLRIITRYFFFPQIFFCHLDLWVEIDMYSWVFVILGSERSVWFDDFVDFVFNDFLLNIKFCAHVVDYVWLGMPI